MKYYFVIFLIGLAGLLILILVEYQKVADGKLHVIFCNVGQGDGILLKSPSGKIILYDSGPDDAILTCLSDNLPFWERTIDLFILSHPHNDHFMGMFSVFPNYTVKSYIGETLVNRSLNFHEFTKALDEEGVTQTLLHKGGTLDVGDGLVLSVRGPSQDFLKRTSPTGEINDSGEFASLVVLVSYGAFKAILTGDSQVSGLTDAHIPNIDVLHVPHHGSRFGLNEQIVAQMDPEVAVISVGKNNYGHPTQEVLTLLKQYGTKLFRTDEDGEVEVISDSKVYFVSE